MARISGGQMNFAQKPDEDGKGDRLHQQRQIDVHDCALTQRVVATAQAGAQFALLTSSIVLTWIPAFAGMTQLFPIAATPRVLLLDICVT